MSNDFGGGNAVNTSTNTGPTYTDEDLSLLPHNNAGPTIIGVVWFLAFISAVFLVLRVYCKFKTNRGLWWDDYILIAAWISSVVDAACWTVAVVGFGYGKHIWDIDPTKIIPMILPMQTAGIFILLAVIWSKTAFGVTLLRITDGWRKILVWVTIVSTNLFLGLSILFNFVSCTPVNKAWDPTVPGRCWDGHTLIDYHIFAAAWSAAMDFVLSGMALILVWSLQMKTKEKIGVGIAMSLGIFAGITSIVKTVELPTLLSKDIYDSAAVVYWGAAEAAVTIIAACIPVLRVLIRHVQSSAREYQRTDEGGTSQVGTKASKTHTVVVSSKKQSTGDDRSDKSILATGGKILMTNDISINYQDRRDGDSVGCYEMDNV